MKKIIILVLMSLLMLTLFASFVHAERKCWKIYIQNDQGELETPTDYQTIRAVGSDAGTGTSMQGIVTSSRSRQPDGPEGSVEVGDQMVYWYAYEVECDDRGRPTDTRIGAWNVPHEEIVAPGQMFGERACCVDPNNNLGRLVSVSSSGIAICQNEEVICAPGQVKIPPGPCKPGQEYEYRCGYRTTSLGAQSCGYTRYTCASGGSYLTPTGDALTIARCNAADPDKKEFFIFGDEMQVEETLSCGCETEDEDSTKCKDQTNGCHTQCKDKGDAIYCKIVDPNDVCSEGEKSQEQGMYKQETQYQFAYVEKEINEELAAYGFGPADLTEVEAMFQTYMSDAVLDNNEENALYAAITDATSDASNGQITIPVYSGIFDIWTRSDTTTDLAYSTEVAVNDDWERSTTSLTTGHGFVGTGMPLLNILAMVAIAGIVLLALMEYRKK